MKRCHSCFGEYDEKLTVCPFCGEEEMTEPAEPIQLAPGTVLADRYYLGKAIGSGGFGIVYKAYDLKLETVVAVKEFYVSKLVTRAKGEKALIISKKSQKEYNYRKDRFLAEARNMAKFGAHRSIPNVFEFFEENNTAYIVMELLRGIALNTYLKQNGGKIDTDLALMITEEVGNALISLHKEGIIHRDVAPDNIFICSDKEIRIKLMDLGAAKLTDSTDEVIDIILKPGYSPVEQYDNSKNIGPWTDIYALGATLYVMLTGKKPDESTNRKIKDEVLPPDKLNPKVSENLSNSVMKAIALDKHMRFKNVSDFLAAIKGEHKVVTLEKEKRRRGVKRTVGLIAAFAVLCGGLFFGYNMYKGKRDEQALDPADISVWFSVADGSTEENAMNSVKEDFESKFPDVTVELRAIPEDEYESEIENAARDGKLPTLFESTGLDEKVLEGARELDAVIGSEQFRGCLFLDGYSNTKRVPIAIEVPMACVITNGTTSVEYTDKYFTSLDDFGKGTEISADDRYEKLLRANFNIGGLSDKTLFMDNKSNTSPVLLTSSTEINNIKKTLTNYEKSYVYLNADEIKCGYTYEWSMSGDLSESEAAAGEKLLSWMFGNVYQSALMISKCSDGQLPVNHVCFDSKVESKNLAPIKDIYEKFVFVTEE